MGPKGFTCSATGSAQDAGRTLAKDMKTQLSGAQPALLVAFSSTSQPLPELLPVLQAEFPAAPVIGASTSGQFTAAGEVAGATVLFALQGDLLVKVGMGSGLSTDLRACIGDAIAAPPAEAGEYPHKTAIMLVDGLAFKGEEATLTAASLLGSDVAIAGGAAGDDLQMQGTWVGYGERVEKDAVAIAQIHSKRPMGVGVAHGHVPVSGEHRVTKSDGNVVHEISGQPAWRVLADQTRAHAAKFGVDPDELSSPTELIHYFARWEPGVLTGGGDSYKCRAPLVRNEDLSLSFVCHIPEGTVFRFMGSDPESQVTSAAAAAREAVQKLGGSAPAAALVFECACRKIILQDQFDRAVQAVAKELSNVPLAGIETYGEIALNVGDMSGFHNTTTVVLAFGA